MGAYLHVKGGGSTQSISINTYYVPVTFLSAPGWGWAGSGGCAVSSSGEGTVSVTRHHALKCSMAWPGAGLIVYTVSCPERGWVSRVYLMLVTGATV